MKLNIAIGLFCCTLLFFSCKSVTISRDHLAEIIVEMSMVDKMLQEQYELHRASDTSLVYAAVLHRHGYTVKEFNNSLTYHLQKPDKLNKKLVSYREQLLEKKNALNKEIDNAARTVPVDSTLIRYIDSLTRCWLLDSVDVRPLVLLPVPDSLPVKTRHHVFHPFS